MSVSIIDIYLLYFDRNYFSVFLILDLKAFERRLTEVIDKVQPTARLWRMVLIVISVCTAAGAGNWLLDPYTTKVSLSTSLWNHPFFTISCIVLLMLFLCGIHKRVVAPSILASRSRQVLADFNMSCDDTGKLILKPRPSLWRDQIIDFRIQTEIWKCIWFPVLPKIFTWKSNCLEKKKYCSEVFWTQWMQKINESI